MATHRIDAKRDLTTNPAAAAVESSMMVRRPWESSLIAMTAMLVCHALDLAGIFHALK